jgi:hypothetical protein
LCWVFVPPKGVAVAGVVESGYGHELVGQLPQLTREELRQLQSPGHVWMGTSHRLVGDVRFLEWSPTGGLRHPTLISLVD